MWIARTPQHMGWSIRILLFWEVFSLSEPEAETGVGNLDDEISINISVFSSDAVSGFSRKRKI